ncbi:mas-related G-protein coupled receptor member H-like [Lacerta agilis]|uniref:mas-related G-protein coupled receptor member H-like n=1 Tax=Lacerta agilis TaxID=80427 RepID=UPI0014193258|nr:mas-related G-protein coupled receptor member H-like [Lacerta agilis]
MINYTIASLPPWNAGEEYYGTYNGTVLSNNSYTDNNSGLALGQYIYLYISLLINILGLWWNGTVIWLLAFCIKRTPFTTYILNLSIADFGLIIVNHIWNILSLLGIPVPNPLLFSILFLIFLFLHSTGQFLLTAISIDRCVAVLFPLWHRCHRPPNTSTTVCASAWVFCFLSPAIHLTLDLANLKDGDILNIQFVLNGFLCLPLMTISALILFIKVCFKSQQRRQGKLIAAILLALLFFIICSFPLNALFITVFVLHSEPPSFLHYAFILACLNSSVNPLIYFLVGRQKRGRCMQNMKAILQNVFKEDENPSEAVEISLETQL